jgi:Family of unknown function (DUF6519)/Right handed beta helix region
MPGDYTRFTFDPLRDYSRVRSQQGRVVLDADLNEGTDGVDHRLRALALDVLGPCTAPIDQDAQPVPAVTGFQIAASGSSFTIGLGRLYLHGLELDNHGPAPFHIEPGLRDQRGAGPVTYEGQPFYSMTSQPPPIPDGRHVVYVDAWEREVTAAEDNSLLDSAVGVDTAARTQVVWRVNVLAADATGITCTTPDDEIPGWTDAAAPSAGRLTTAGVMPPADASPCSVPPDGGYVGWDNRLYRVEVHDGGTTAHATFKWSRDNASVATRVTGVDSTGSVLTVVRTGRDDVQRIREQAWVEILDDDAELSGTPGFLATVQSAGTADDGSYYVTLSNPLPPNTFNPADPTRRTRLRQWDQTVGVSAEGTLNVAATLSGFVLEDGVQITFSADPVGGTLKSGDYWTFAARAADGSVQVLTAALPQGPTHFYGRLAIIDLPNEVVDCRGVWPPLQTCECCGDCTVCVTPQTHASGQLTIQTAVSQVSAAGGTVCLAAGTYDLTEPVDVNGAQSVTIRGQGYATILTYGSDTSALIVENSSYVTIRDLRIIVTIGAGLPSAAGITLRQCANVQVESVTVGTSSKARAAEAPGAPGAGAVAGDALPGQQGCAIALGQSVLGVTIRDCVLTSRVGIARGSADTSLIVYQLEISGCTVAANAIGICLDDQDIFYIARVRDCLIVAATGPGILWHAVAETDRNLVISESYVSAAGTALDLACSGADVRGCVIDGDQSPGGVALALSAPAATGTLSDVRIQDCRLSADGGIFMTGAHQDVQISGCTVTGVTTGIVTSNISSGRRVRVRDNDVRVSGTNPTGIGLNEVTDADVRGNSVSGLGASIDAGLFHAVWMIWLNLCPSATVAGNTVTNFVSPSAMFGVGIAVWGDGDVDIASNVVEVADGVATQAGQPWSAVGIEVATGFAPTLADSGQLASGQPRVAADRISAVTNSSYLVVSGQRVRVTPDAARPLAVAVADPATSVRGNRLEISGVDLAIDLETTGPVSFNDNRVRHAGSSTGAAGPGSAVGIIADSLGASGNGIQAPAGLGAMDATGSAPGQLARRLAIVGNITTSPITVDGNALPGPWQNLNVVPS